MGVWNGVCEFVFVCVMFGVWLKDKLILGVIDKVGVDFGLSVGFGVSNGVRGGVEVTDGVWGGVEVGVSVWFGDAPGVPVFVGVWVDVLVWFGVLVFVRVGVWLAVIEGVFVCVTLGVSVGVCVGGIQNNPHCLIGSGDTKLPKPKNWGMFLEQTYAISLLEIFIETITPDEQSKNSHCPEFKPDWDIKNWVQGCEPPTQVEAGVYVGVGVLVCVFVLVIAGVFVLVSEGVSVGQIEVLQIDETCDTM